MEEEETPSTSEASPAQVRDEAQRNEELNTLTETEFILAPPRVRGFDLRTKEWCKFFFPLPFFSPFPR